MRCFNIWAEVNHSSHPTYTVLRDEQNGVAAYFWKGRVALYAILKTLDIGAGDAVVVPGYTCVVVPSAVSFAGAKPIFADIDLANYNSSLAHIAPVAEAATAKGLDVRAVVVQHTYGIPANMGPILRWAEQRNIWVIEDCCHAWGSRYGETADDLTTAWKPVGALGDAAFFSSQWSKPFTTGLGGWAQASGELQRRLRDFAATQCRAPGLRETFVAAVQLALYRTFYRPALFWVAQDILHRLTRWGLFIGSSDASELELNMPVDYAKRMSRVHRHLAARGARRQQAYIAQRRRVKTWYDEALSAAGFPTFQSPEYADSVLLRYPLRVRNRSTLLTLGRQQHIELGDWFNHPLHPAGANVEALGWRAGLCPTAEQMAREVVNLPMHSRISRRHVRQAVDFLQRYAEPA